MASDWLTALLPANQMPGLDIPGSADIWWDDWYKPFDSDVPGISGDKVIPSFKMVDFLIGHYTYRMFPPAIDIISTSLAVAYSDRKYTN